MYKYVSMDVSVSAYMFASRVKCRPRVGQHALMLGVARAIVVAIVRERVFVP